MTTKADYQVYL